ncbi:hypothetical protein M0R72_06610 [Candidatus Pacearchaeota archaeon]|nr:hypothetical protein [Candidatus Pacearchaeota archaeon]
MTVSKGVKKYIEGFLAGQTIAYCEQVRLGAKLAANIDCDQTYVDKLLPIVADEGCRASVVSTSPGRVCFWIFRYEFVKSIIDHLQSVSENEIANDFDIWIAGKLFGYADCEIASCINGKMKVAPK